METKFHRKEIAWREKDARTDRRYRNDMASLSGKRVEDKWRKNQGEDNKEGKSFASGGDEGKRTNECPKEDKKEMTSESEEGSKTDCRERTITEEEQRSERSRKKGDQDKEAGVE